MNNFSENEKNTKITGDENTNKILYNCKYCSKKYKLLTRLQTHEKSCAQTLQEKKCESEKACKTCGQIFKYAKKLERHELMHTLQHNFSCKYCQLHFATRHELNLHRTSEHSDKARKRKCKMCPDSVFETKEEYFVHINEEHKGKCGDYHMCCDCGKQFKTKGELNNHNKSRCGTIKLYICKVCGQKLMTAGSLYNHMLRHTVKCSNMCGYCGKMFLTIGQLRVHERTHTQEKAFVCNVCGKGFCHRQSLITHSSLHTGVKPYQCENCGGSFSCVGNLIKHRQTHADTCGSIPLTNHRVNNPSTKLKVKINTPITSKIKLIKKEKEILEKLTVYKNKLRKKPDPVENKATDEVSPQADEPTSEGSECNNHTDDATKQEPEREEVPLTKPLTEKPQPRRRKRKIKVELEEFVKAKGNGTTSEYVCQYCNKRYTNVRLLFRHEKGHEKLAQISSYKCSCCKGTFETREACRQHQQNVHADILGCQDCDKIFSNVDSLRSHIRIFHKGVPKKVYVYVCDKCGVQFRQKILLHQHEKNNCERGPMYECEICGKSFHSVHTRKSHLRIHDPKKKFLCKFCGKNFRWKGQLKVHERSHTGEKPFKCLYCPKAFGYRESLITHTSLHTGIKPHLCRACGSRFSCIGNLIKHRTTHASTCGVWYTKNQ
ncbi:hypothetical protein RI129_010631 [Pyrocoelia pectoralis]|uniref:C2H2-type domain-containing protein n=1 Tax=Pyrocoelia pectoralis TaxID=417401 RepID=A0AAN7UZ34_9COLE